MSVARMSGKASQRGDDLARSAVGRHKSLQVEKRRKDILSIRMCL